MEQVVKREAGTLRFLHQFTPEVRELLDSYVAEENARNAPAKLDMRAVVNAAVVEYIHARQEQRAA